MIIVKFSYLTGLKRPIFRQARLRGSWDHNGRYSDTWSELPMQEIIAEDGCPAFTASMQFDESEVGRQFRWGVLLNAPVGANTWGITTETDRPQEQHRYREFDLQPSGTIQEERFYFTYSRWLGAQKFYSNPSLSPDIRFTVWAPNALKAEVVFASRNHGFIDDDGTGIDPAMPVIGLTKKASGIFESKPIRDFHVYVGAPYMFRIENAQGNVVYKTDIHSRWQSGRGAIDPRTGSWDGDYKTLDGSISCSVVIDQDVVRKEFEPPARIPPGLLSDPEFWTTEFTPGLPVPNRIEDMVIYELHIGSLGFGHTGPGTLSDAMNLLDYLTSLGVNAVELLPVSEYSGDLSWGYGDTHHFVIESSAGGRDKYKHFIRECHRRGIAVIQDVVYNHYDNNAERAEWAYDSEVPEQNIYYWYEGRSTDYINPAGGYLDNGSSGYTPRFWEEPVRQLFISSAAEFVEEFHVDGLRVDLTQAIHRDNKLHADGSSVGRSNLFGQKFLREWSRTLRMIRPTVMLIAEDHSEWNAVLKSPDVGGLGFDSSWFASFYHNLIGDSHMGHGAARLIQKAGFGDDQPLPVSQFSGFLWGSRFNKVVYHESHDEAGNSGGSMRTCKVAVNDAALSGSTRDVAEARCRVAFGLSLLSAGTPMFFMGEEIVAQKNYKYDNIPEAKEDLLGERIGNGSMMFRFYQDAIKLRVNHPAIRSHEIDILHAFDQTRIIAFTRRQGEEELLVVASLNNHPFPDGYVLQSEPYRLPEGAWQEIFNSDSSTYGGNNVGNYGTAVWCENGRVQLRIPANGFVVFQRR